MRPSTASSTDEANTMDTAHKVTLVVALIDLQCEKNAEEFPPITDDHTVTNTRQLLFHCVFDRHRSNVLAAGGDQDF